MWLEKVLDECEGELKQLKEYGNLIKLSAEKSWFEIEVLYKITGIGGYGRVRIENKRGEGTMLYYSRNGQGSVMSTAQSKIKTLLRVIIEDCEGKHN